MAALPILANKGFSIQDEGSYVLSYRWWDSNPYFVSDAQLFYGPLFEAFHYDIAALRVIRLVMVIASNAGFGWAFASWLARQRRLPYSLHRRLSITLLLTASGGATYLWSPLTPGYYGLTAEASLGLVALMLAALTCRSRIPVWNPALVGFLAVLSPALGWPIQGCRRQRPRRSSGARGRRPLPRKKTRPDCVTRQCPLTNRGHPLIG